MPFPARACACSVRFFRQGRPLRSRERTPRGLDGADGQSLKPARKGNFPFDAPLRVASKGKNPKPFEGVFR